MFSIWSFSTSLLVLVNSFSNIIFGNVEYSYVPENVQIIRLILFVLLLPMVRFGLSKSYKKVLRIVPDKTIYLMALYPIIAFILQINTFSSTLGNFRNLNSSYDNLLFILFISLGYVLVFAGISASSKKISLEFTYKTIESQLELQRRNYKTLNESLNQIYALKHDVRHHVSAIETLVKQKKFNEALEYITQFNKSEPSITVSTLCNNFAADSIVKYNMSLALSKNIEFKADLNIPEDIGINPLDLCIVLGNCLENAIEACEKQNVGTRKYIELISEIVGAHIVLRIRNSFDGKLIKGDKQIKSTKDGAYHGFGLSNVSETVRRYNGNIDISDTNDKFEITIIMCTSAAFS
jgi:signal transduction histidine kinase